MKTLISNLKSFVFYVSNKTGMKSTHKGIGYENMTRDIYDGPRGSKARRSCKRMAAKIQRRHAKKVILKQLNEIHSSHV